MGTRYREYITSKRGTRSTSGSISEVYIDVFELLKGLENLAADVADKEARRKIVNEVAEAMIVPAMAKNTPEFEGRNRGGVAREKQPKVLKKNEHYRYNTNKLISGIRAGKGRGRIVQTIRGGNLKHSIFNLVTHRSKRAKFKRANGAIVGPVYRRTKAKVIGRNPRNADGWYAHMALGSLRAFTSKVTVATIRQVGPRAIRLAGIKAQKYAIKKAQKNGFR